MRMIQKESPDEQFEDLRGAIEMVRRQVNQLERDVIWLRARLAILLPERAHCPSCKAPVGNKATSCVVCGSSWSPPAARPGRPRKA